MNEQGKNALTQNEELFCELYVHGESLYCGNSAKCYQEAFGKPLGKSRMAARKLINEPRIQEQITKLNELNFEENMFLKKRLTENLLKIVDETSEAQFTDRNGTLLSTAPLRSVAVQAIKTLMEMHPIKEASVNKLSIESEGEGGIVFNVIVPNQEKKQENENN